jgi:hypothetical protein
MVAAALAAITLLGVLGGELLARFIPEMILRKVGAMSFKGVEFSMWFEELQSEKRTCLEFERRVSWNLKSRQALPSSNGSTWGVALKRFEPGSSRI